MGLSVVSIGDFKKEKVTQEEHVPNGLSNREIEAFLKVCNHLRNISTEKFVSIKIFEEEMEVEAHVCHDTEFLDHKQSRKSGQSVRGLSVLTLTTSMDFKETDNNDNIEDFRDILQFLEKGD